ncbi:MAG TPA: alpha/beta hydrolase, partial [Nevskiaceae bacterium]|nr:alpha/beta hydrolase [Nevskiaceae bacterium]
MKRVWHRRLRRKAINGVIRSYARLGEYVAEMRAARKKVEVLRDVTYGPNPYNKLDIYRPHFSPRPLKVLLYIHGGGFMLCSKETHRGIALTSAARSNYLVFNIDYRLAPHFQFPGAHEDACRAYA